MQRVFVKVLGFSDVERHALNTLFRLSEERDTGYALWSPDYGVAAQMALIDSESHEAVVEFESPSNHELKMIWVGAGAPPTAWRSFQRPIQWPDVIAAMDQLFGPPPDLDFDLGATTDEEAQDTLPPEPGPPPQRALIAAADRNERLYLRARLSLAGLTQADEAATAADALELARLNRYSILLVDFGLGGEDGWDFVRQLRTGGQGGAHLIVTKPGVSVVDRLRALWSGRPALLAMPADPARLKALLERA
ncbi:response regulator [Ramlibacter tataouinensis]|uniref:response regulator n=1 Tax=Ramlibacter tataouinensis TaxID=94132 RepID=UPI0022F3FB5C|nr:response regulator [Ramlibacter tataouinensis]WBY02159.1 response regulator [Ramlibacter tataouinensis]